MGEHPSHGPHLLLLNIIKIYFSFPVKEETKEISEKIQKSLITWIRNRLHRCEKYSKIRKICVIIFEI